MNANYVYIDPDFSITSQDKEETVEPKKDNITIEVADNGFIAKIGDRSYVFSDLDSLDGWINENLKTPKKGKEFVDSVINPYGEMRYDPNKFMRGMSYDNIQVAPVPTPAYQPSVTWCDSSTTTTNTTSGTSTFSWFGDIIEAMGKKKKK